MPNVDGGEQQRPSRLKKYWSCVSPFFFRLIAPLAIANTLNCHGKGHQVILAEVF